MNQKIKNKIQSLRLTLPKEIYTTLTEYRKSLTEEQVEFYYTNSEEIDSDIAVGYEHVLESILDIEAQPYEVSDKLMSVYESQNLIEKIFELADSDPLLSALAKKANDNISPSFIESFATTVFYLGYRDEEPIIGGAEIINDLNLNLN